VVVDDFDVCRPRLGPPKTDSKLIIDPDAVLPFPITLQRLETVTWWHSQVIESAGNLQLSEFATRNGLETHEPANAAPSRQRLGVGIAERDDHPEQ